MRRKLEEELKVIFECSKRRDSVQVTVMAGTPYEVENGIQHLSNLQPSERVISNVLENVRNLQHDD
jgi:hypothetical protein